MFKPETFNECLPIVHMESATQSTALKGGERGPDSVEDIVSEFYTPLQGTWKEQVPRSTRQSLLVC